METVISKEAALKELEAIQEILDVVYDEGDKEKIIPAIMAGSFTADEAEQKITYTLINPIEQKNKDRRNTIVFKTPSVTDMEYINKGFTVKVDKDQSTIMDMGQMMERTSRAVIKLSGWPLGLVDRISRKDMRVFSGLFNFFD